MGFAPELEAVRLHNEFVRIHPFQDGNDRISRLLMAYAKAGEFPPVILARNKLCHFTALEAADTRHFPEFVSYLGDLAAVRCNAAAARSEAILDDRTNCRHGIGGPTSGGVYFLPQASEMAPPLTGPVINRPAGPN